MRRGKEIAQGSHASIAWLTSRLTGNGSPELTTAERQWVTGSFRKIVCQVPGEAELHALIDNAGALGVEAHLITDSGLTEFDGVPTVTAAAIGPDWDSLVDRITGELELY
jgi:PTH2 family peptidyl-tRNA hydrolase